MSKPQLHPRYVVFASGKRIAEGSEAEISAFLSAQKLTIDTQDSDQPMPLVFDVDTGAQIELPTVVATAPGQPDTPARPGRPKLGVIAREVTLLPQDWEWLNAQSGGASVTLRKLVLMARRSNEGAGAQRRAQIFCYRFIAAIAGNEVGYEEATRALFAGDAERFATHCATWPADVRTQALKLAHDAFAPLVPVVPVVHPAPHRGSAAPL